VYSSQTQLHEVRMTAFAEAVGTTDLRAPAKRAWILGFCLSLATALAIISPYAWRGNASGHDFSFHAASWMDAATQLREGTLLPRWTERANYGFGEPRFIFYPPISWLLGAALSFVAPWAYVPAVFIVLTQTMAGLSALALGRCLFGEREALFFAVCFAANPYALLIAYMRSDFAEQLALAFFPLLVLAALRLTGVIPERFQARRCSVVFLAIIFATVWLTNAPAGVISSYSLAILFTWLAIKNKSWQPLLQGGAGLALGFGLAGFYLVPAAYEQSWVNISEALSPGLQPSQNFLYTAIADPEHNAFNRIASNVAMLMIILTGVFAAASFPRNKNPTSRPASIGVWATLLVLAVTAAFLMLPVSGMFWSFLPKLRFVQFPWRWMSILTIPFACFISATTAQKRGAVSTVIMIALAVTLGCTAAYMVRHTWWDAEDIPVLLEAIDNDQGFEGVDEYDPAGDDHSALPQKSERFSLSHPAQRGSATPEAKVHVEHWSAEKKEMRITTREPVLLSLRLLNYPAWRVEVNDAAVVPRRMGETAQMILPLAAGASHVLVQFTRTRDRTIGGILSAASALICGLTLIARRRR
jgi:hypothetical protein